MSVSCALFEAVVRDPLNHGRRSTNNISEGHIKAMSREMTTEQQLFFFTTFDVQRRTESLSTTGFPPCSFRSFFVTVLSED